MIANQLKISQGLKRAPLNFFSDSGIRVYDIDQVIAFHMKFCEKHPRKDSCGRPSSILLFC